MFSLDFPVECRRSKWLKYCDNNYKNEDNRLHVNNVNNLQKCLKHFLLSIVIEATSNHQPYLSWPRYAMIRTSHHTHCFIAIHWDGGGLIEKERCRFQEILSITFYFLFLNTVYLLNQRRFLAERRKCYIQRIWMNWMPPAQVDTNILISYLP